MLRLDIDDFFQFGSTVKLHVLIEKLPGVAEDVAWLLLQHLEQEHRNHVLQLRVLPQVDLVIHPIAHLFLLQLYHLLLRNASDPSNVVAVRVLLLVVHVLDLIATEVFLLRHRSYKKYNLLVDAANRFALSAPVAGA